LSRQSIRQSIIIFYSVANFQHMDHATRDFTLPRRTNLNTLLHEFLKARIAQGAAPKGLEQEFAKQLQISPSMLSQIKSSRPIGDKLARQMEVLCGVAVHWLDEEQDATEQLPDDAEDHFAELARQAWRQCNAKQKRELRLQLRSLAESEKT
jgi:ribosome-binding protein aMBF1 (putative translation factor)